MPCPLARGAIAQRPEDVGCRSCANKGEESNTPLTPEFPEHLTGDGAWEHGPPILLEPNHLAVSQLQAIFQQRYN